MSKETLLECLDCGYINNTFNVAIVDSFRGSFLYAAQCPLCDSKKIKIINWIHKINTDKPNFEICISEDGPIQISHKKHTSQH